MKVLNYLDDEKKKKTCRRESDVGTLGQIPKMASIETPQERKLTEEEKAKEHRQDSKPSGKEVQERK